MVAGVTYTNKSVPFGYSTWFPEPLFFNQMNDSINNRMKEYQKLKASLIKTRDGLQKQLDVLIANNYNCQ